MTLPPSPVAQFGGGGAKLAHGLVTKINQGEGAGCRQADAGSQPVERWEDEICCYGGNGGGHGSISWQGNRIIAYPLVTPAKAGVQKL